MQQPNTITTPWIPGSTPAQWSWTTGDKRSSARLSNEVELTELPAAASAPRGWKFLHENYGEKIDGDINYQTGTISPGHSPGILTVTGDFTQGATATLQIELGGLIVGTQYDHAGTANLDGALDLLPLAPHTDPATRGTADDFTIITSGDRSSTFSTV